MLELKKKLAEVTKLVTELTSTINEMELEREKNKRLLNSMYGVITSENLLCHILEKEKTSTFSSHKFLYYIEHLPLDFIGILPEDCNFEILSDNTLFAIIETVFNHSVGFAPQPKDISEVEVFHCDTVNRIDFVVKNTGYTVWVSDTQISLYISPPCTDEEGYDVCNDTMYTIAKFPKYNPSNNPLPEF